MAFEQRDNSGSIFVNDKKEKDSHPDRKGSAMIGGVEYWVSGWIKEGKNGKFMSLSFQPKETGGVTKKSDTKNHVIHTSNPSSSNDDFQKEVKKQGMDKDKPFSDFDDSIPF